MCERIIVRSAQLSGVGSLSAAVAAATEIILCIGGRHLVYASYAPAVLQGRMDPNSVWPLKAQKFCKDKFCICFSVDLQLPSTKAGQKTLHTPSSTVKTERYAKLYRGVTVLTYGDL